MPAFLLPFADWFLNLFHLVIVVTLCIGFIPRATRKFHRILISVVTLCWLVIGPLTGKHIGYCPVTDWAWQVRTARGETNLEYGYINYLIEKFGIYLTHHETDLYVGIIFASIWAATIFLWIKDYRAHKKTLPV